MAWVEIVKVIQADIDSVFAGVADIREFSKALPHVVSYELLTEEALAVGTQFREVREMGGREMVNVLEITECEPPNFVRMIADTNGTIWDTGYRLRSVASEGADETHTELTLSMDARPYRLMTRIMTPLIRKMVQKAVDRDMQLVKEYLERER